MEVFYLVKVQALTKHGVIPLIRTKLFFILQYCNEIAVSDSSFERDIIDSKIVLQLAKIAFRAWLG